MRVHRILAIGAIMRGIVHDRMLDQSAVENRTTLMYYRVRDRERERNKK